MHAEADFFVAACARHILAESGLDVGGRDVNGSCRRHFIGTTWTGLDIAPGPGVDIVADFGMWFGVEKYDLVLCTEVLEHDLMWHDIIESAADHLVDGGHLVLTAAMDPRKPHSAIDGGPLRDGESYGNVDPMELWDALHAHNLEILRFDADKTLGHGGNERGDIRAMARKC